MKTNNKTIWTMVLLTVLIGYTMGDPTTTTTTSSTTTTTVARDLSTNVLNGLDAVTGGILTKGYLLGKTIGTLLGILVMSATIAWAIDSVRIDRRKL